MGRSFSLGNPLGRTCFARAQAFEANLNSEESRRRLNDGSHKNNLRSFLRVHITRTGIAHRAQRNALNLSCYAVLRLFLCGLSFFSGGGG